MPSAPSTRLSAVSVAAAVPPAGTVTWAGDTVNRPAAAGFPSGPVMSVVTSRVTDAAPAFVYVTVFVTGWSSECGHENSPSAMLAGDADTSVPMAAATSTRPAPWPPTPCRR